MTSSPSPAPRRSARRGRGSSLLGTLVLLPLLLGTVFQTSHAQAVTGEDLPVVEHVLDNGMRLLVLPRPGAPTVSVVVEFGVGSMHETLGETGIAHLLEHLLFKGSTTVGTRDLAKERALQSRMDALQDSILRAKARDPRPDTSRIAALRNRIEALEDSARTVIVSNEFDEILSRNGARGLNATTSHESTRYFVELPSNRIQLWFVLEADRMMNPVFREFYSEREVVLEERRSRVETSPSGILQTQHLATAFQVHPYGVPVIGHRSDIENLTRERTRDFYRRHYGPNNAVVALVGDLDPDRVQEMAEAYFGRIPRGEDPPPVLSREPDQRGERRIEVLHDAEPQLRIGWRVPEVFHEDTPALLMLQSLLTGGRTARLNRRLVRDDRLATFVSASIGPGSHHPRLFTVDTHPRAPHTPRELEEAIYEELDRLRETPPEESELERVRNQLRASRVRRLQSNLGLAFQLSGSSALYDDWAATFRFTRRIEEVTPEEVRNVVERYLTEERRTVATLVPEGGSDPSDVSCEDRTDRDGKP